jgi:PleD family two-component response regulator
MGGRTYESHTLDRQPESGIMTSQSPKKTAKAKWSLMPIRVLIADDHEMVRKGLRGFIELDSELKIVGEAADGEAALRMAKQFRPDVVLMDLLMPIMDVRPDAGKGPGGRTPPA